MSRTVALPSGERLPAFGVGTWRMGERTGARRGEVAAIRAALDLGVRLVDTAEMYGDGGAEEVVGEALAGRRDEVFVVSKVTPHNASRRGTAAACERSLARLRTDRIDLYLLHWRGNYPLAETLDAFERLKDAGKIRHWGVSNFDADDLRELAALPAGGACAANQVYYSASTRGVEFDVAPWLRERSMPLMAYCPLDEGRLAGDATLAAVGARIGASAAQVAIAWLASRPGVIAIPKASADRHLRENVAAAALDLGADALAEIERRFPAPRRATALRIV